MPGGRALDNLEKADKAWRQLCDADRMPFREVIAETQTPLTPSDFQAFDVVILGGVWRCDQDECSMARLKEDFVYVQRKDWRSLPH